MGETPEDILSRYPQEKPVCLNYKTVREDILALISENRELKRQASENGILITDVRIRRTYQETRLKALASVTVNNDLAVHDIKVIEGPERLFVAMPSRKDDAGVFRDIAHPITQQARALLESAVLTAYHEYLSEKENSMPASLQNNEEDGTDDKTITAEMA